MRYPPKEPPANWEIKEKVREAYNRLVLYEVLCREENGHGETFHPEFAKHVNNHIQNIKLSPKGRDIFDEMVQEYGQEAGEIRYIFLLVLPGYLAMRKYFEMLRTVKGGPSREEVAKHFHELGADNWTKDQCVEYLNTIIPNDKISEEIVDMVKTEFWTNSDKWDEILTMAQIVYFELVDEGKNIAKLVE